MYFGGEFFRGCSGRRLPTLVRPYSTLVLDLGVHGRGLLHSYTPILYTPDLKH